ncbi:DedA family protein/thiosulfate sulfurtransferase GlpE [Glaciimonas immobilis]|uniref:Membrane protein DedA with SNARE-associated domain n=1 Tax=Glaciimonas immobilis TaxID=728004 RepID=A0A840RNQ4_9BURK|nr:DedA family protein/thiosulfate sulfurtransferase GlpE [Glaciimonas immobilis]KAF3999274.1 sulfurtransferase [Glaciimonas immobilis]MBB5198742.1 membrane protein DedA with SNARE-associated domain [Glaciimonas immobilis]
MSYLLQLIEQYGLIIVFLNVLLSQLGVPVPAYPTLIITGALASGSQQSAAVLLLTAVVAALIADYGWYLAGKRYGRKVMGMLCRVSLSPDSCVRQTEAIYGKWGAPSLLIAKFIPGFASIASALAGTIGTRRTTFVLFDGLGATLWAGLAIFLGSRFSTAIDQLLLILEELGESGLIVIVAAIGIFVIGKWWQRKRFMRSLSMARISVAELDQLLQQGIKPAIVDVRSPVAQKNGWIPGAVVTTMQQINTFTLDAPTDQEVIVYCACPNEASAAIVAKLLMQRGYKKVRPLTGGIDAWVAAGYNVET